MARTGGLVVQVLPAPGSDVQELEELADALRAELLELDIDDVEPLAEQDVPERAKGLGSLAGWLAVQLGTEGKLKRVVEALRAWAARNQREVEITIGAKTLKVKGATAEQQESLIQAWLDEVRVEREGSGA